MKLAVVVTAAHNREMSERAFGYAEVNATEPETEVVYFDNGVGLEPAIHDGTNLGNYPIFHKTPTCLDADVYLFIHNDLYIYEPGYDARIIAHFERDEKLAVAGFVGSIEIDQAGGRGFGPGATLTNYMGLAEGASPAEDHGQRYGKSLACAVLDGCALAIRRTHLENELTKIDGFPPHHHYDRLFCLQALHAGLHVRYIGVACDHLNGRTSGRLQAYHDLARDWCLEHKVYRRTAPELPKPKEVFSGQRHADVNWDHQVYLEAEHQVVSEWRDKRQFFPLRVGPDHTIYHTHPKRGVPEPVEFAV